MPTTCTSVCLSVCERVKLVMMYVTTSSGRRRQPLRCFSGSKEWISRRRTNAVLAPATSHADSSIDRRMQATSSSSSRHDHATKTISSSDTLWRTRCCTFIVVNFLLPIGRKSFVVGLWTFRYPRLARRRLEFDILAVSKTSAKIFNI